MIDKIYDIKSKLEALKRIDRVVIDEANNQIAVYPNPDLTVEEYSEYVIFEDLLEFEEIINENPEDVNRRYILDGLEIKGFKTDQKEDRIFAYYFIYK